MIAPDSGLWSLVRGPLLLVLIAVAVSPWLLWMIRQIEWDDRSDVENALLGRDEEKWT